MTAVLTPKMTHSRTWNHGENHTFERQGPFSQNLSHIIIIITASCKINIEITATQEQPGQLLRTSLKAWPWSGPQI